MIKHSRVHRQRVATIIRSNILGNALSPIKWKLYSNDYTPGDNPQLTDFTECAFPGYAQIQNKAWNFPILNVEEYLLTAADYYVWTAAGGDSGNIYGWYTVLTDAGIDYLWLCERFTGAPLSLTNGQSLFLLPAYSTAPQ